MDSKLMIYVKNGAICGYDERIFKKGGWEMYGADAPIGIPVDDDAPAVAPAIEGAVADETPKKKPGRPQKTPTVVLE